MVVIDIQGMETIGNVRVVYFIRGYRKSGHIPCRDSTGAEKHDTGRGKGCAVAFLLVKQEIRNKVFPCGSAARMGRIAVIILQELTYCMVPCSLFLIGSGVGNRKERTDTASQRLRNIQIMRIYKTPVGGFSVFVSEQVGIGGMIGSEESNHSSGRHIHDIGIICFRAGSLRSPVKDKSIEGYIQVIRNEIIWRLDVDGGYTEYTTEIFKIHSSGIIGIQSGGKILTMAHDFHKPRALIVPFALIMGEEWFNLFIV